MFAKRPGDFLCAINKMDKNKLFYSLFESFLKCSSEHSEHSADKVNCVIKENESKDVNKKGALLRFWQKKVLRTNTTAIS